MRTNDSAGHRRVEPEPVIFGIHPVEELVRTRPHQIERMYFEQPTGNSPLFQLLKECRRQRLVYQVVRRQKLDYLCGTAKHQGVVVVCPVKAFLPVEQLRGIVEKAGSHGLLLIPSSIEDPRNLGAVVRSAAAFGVQAILLEQKHSAPLGSLVSKSAAGALEHIEVCRPHNLAQVVTDLKKSGMRVVGAEAGEKAKPREIDLTGPLVMVLGGEHRGIPPYLRNLCDAVAGIPMCDAVQSLNVSVAAGIMLYECFMQREVAAAQPCGPLT